MKDEKREYNFSWVRPEMQKAINDTYYFKWGWFLACVSVVAGLWLIAKYVAPYILHIISTVWKYITI